MVAADRIRYDEAILESCGPLTQYVRALTKKGHLDMETTHTGRTPANRKAEIYKPGTVREHHQQLGEEQEADSPSASEGTSPGMP